MTANKEYCEICREVQSSEIDSKYRIQLQTITNIAQDGAAAQCYACGMSIPHLQEENKTWVIVKQHYEISRYPEFMDTVTLKTWAKQRQGFFFFRDITLTIQDCPEPAVKATSSWMILDMHTGRPCRAADEYTENMISTGVDALPSNFKKIALPDTYTCETALAVTMSDIDSNKHVNNTNYIRWLLASVPFEITSEKLVAELDTYFIAQARFGDRLVSKTAVTENDGTTAECVHTIVNKETGTEYFRARTVWKPETQLSVPFKPAAYTKSE